MIHPAVLRIGSRVLLTLALLYVTAAAAAAQGLSWIPLGPSGSFRYEPVGADSSGNLFVARYTYSGVYRSTDRGDRWELVAPQAMTSFAATSVAIFIVDGTGHVLRSTDAGRTWTQLAPYSAKGDTAMLSVAASPDGALYAMTRVFFPNVAELLRSTDDGDTWVTLFTPGERGMRIVGFAPDGSMFINADTLAYRSSDRGETWNVVTAFARSIGEVRFDGMGRTYTGYGRVIHASTDNGATWTAGDSLPVGGFSHLAIANDGTMVMAGGGQTFSSIDAGASWRRVTMPITMNLPSALIAVGNHFFTSGSSGSGANQPGAGILRSIDRGETFQTVGVGLPGPAVHSISLLDDSVIFVTTADYGRFRASRRDGSWTTLDNGGRDVRKGPDGALYVIASSGYDRSSDGGLSWLRSDTVAGMYFQSGAPGPGGIYAASTVSGSIWTTADSGRTWTRLDSQFVETVSALAYDSSGALIVGTVQAGVYRQELATNRLRALDARVSSTTVTDILVTPQGTIYLGTNGSGVRRSTDNGATFEDASAGLGSLVIHALAATRRGDLLAGTDSSLYLSRSDGEHWGFEGAGLPSLVTAIAIDPDDLVAVGTSGGVYLSRESAASAPQITAGAREISVRCAPNPASGIVRIELGSFEGSARVDVVDVRVVDPLGNVIATLHEGMLPRGTSQFTWDARDVAAGAYRVTVRGESDITSNPLLIVR